MNITITFLSPVEVRFCVQITTYITANAVRKQLSDWTKQSLPFSYVSFEATSTDENLHDVQVYSDVSAGEIDNTIDFDFTGSYIEI